MRASGPEVILYIGFELLLKSKKKADRTKETATSCASPDFVVCLSSQERRLTFAKFITWQRDALMFSSLPPDLLAKTLKSVARSR